MITSRIHRLAHQLVGLSRQAVHYDVATKERLTFKNRAKALNKYLGQRSVFGSFTSIPKLGINPQTEYNTPVGVYAYPIDYILQEMSGDVFSVPFAGDKAYLHIFSVSGIDRALRFDMNDTAKLNEFREEAPGDFESPEYNKVRDQVLRIAVYVKQHLNELPTKDFSSKSETQWKEWRKRLEEKTGFVFNDPDDDIQSIIMNMGNLYFYGIDKLIRDGGFPINKVMDEIRDRMARLERAEVATFPYEDRIMKLPEVQAMGLEGYAEFKVREVLGEGQRVECDQAFAWNMTRHLSNFNPSKWTGLLRNIGMIGAVDDGTGTIHENEPTQAVFFDPSSVKVLEVIPNESPEIRGGGSAYNRSKVLSEWATDVEGYMHQVVDQFYVALRNFLQVGSRQAQGNVFARLSWLQQHGRKFSDSWNPDIINNILKIIDERREETPANKAALDRIVQTLKRFLR